MKKDALVILFYALVVLTLIVTVKLAQNYFLHNHATHEPMVAGCDDNPPTTSASE